MNVILRVNPACFHIRGPRVLIHIYKEILMFVEKGYASREVEFV